MKQFITRDIPALTIGLDLGKKFSYVFAVRRDGEILADERVATSKANFRKYFGQWKNAEVVFEVGSLALWVNALLAELGHKPLAVNARELPQIYKTKKKSDRIDARKLCEARWAQELPLVELRSLEMHADLAVARSRMCLVETRTTLINHVRSVCLGFGLALKKCDAAYFHRHMRAAIPEDLETALRPLLTHIESLTLTIKEFDKEIDRLSKEKYPETRALTTAPGVASLTALVFVLTLHNCERFRSSRKVGAHIGLVSKQDQSCARDPQLRITKAGDAYLRKLLVTAGHTILGSRGADSELRRYGQRICPEGGKNRGAKKRAVVAVARKLAVLLHHLWREGENYEPFPNGKPVPTSDPPRRGKLAASLN